jgi:molybdopterin-guanine dinucleotide biosynthesis protein A
VSSPLIARPLPLLGVLAGGQSRRMGGRDKAWLPAPGGGGALIERLLGLGSTLGLPVVVVGGRAPRGVQRLNDERTGVGPIGGLCALLAHAGTRPVIALACDLPYVGATLLAQLVDTESTAAVLAPREPASGKWQPLFARYEPERALPVFRAALGRKVRSLQTVLRDLAVEELVLTADEHALLRDWDQPSDVG